MIIVIILNVEQTLLYINLKGNHGLFQLGIESNSN